MKRSPLLRPVFNRVAETLPYMAPSSGQDVERIPASNPVYTRPNPVRLPEYFYFPSSSEATSRDYCCEQTPLHTMMKNVIVRIHQLTTGLPWPSDELCDDIHKTVQESANAVIELIEYMKMKNFFQIIGITLPDGMVADQAVYNSLNPETMSYSNAAGEYILTLEYVRKVLRLPDRPLNSQYSASQPVTQYFLDFVSTNTAVATENTLKLQAVESREDLFQVHTNVKENKAFLPCLFCLGMLFGCPYAGSITPSLWIMHKNLLFMLAAAFGILEVDIAEVLFQALQEDIINLAKSKTIFCIPIWRALFSLRRAEKDAKCIGHIPRTKLTYVDINRFAEIIDRTVGIKIQCDEDLNKHYDRILNTYYLRPKRTPSVIELSAILMFEQNRTIGKHFRPKLLWVDKRRGLCLDDA